MNLFKKYNLKIENRLVRKPIKAKSEKLEEASFHWIVVLSKPQKEHPYCKEISFDYFTGSGLLNKFGNPIEQKIIEVLDNLQLDSRSVELNFIDFCNEFGYNTDSIKDLNLYKKCCESAIELRSFFGYSVFKEFTESELE